MNNFPANDLVLCGAVIIWASGSDACVPEYDRDITESDPRQEETAGTKARGIPASGRNSV